MFCFGSYFLTSVCTPLLRTVLTNHVLNIIFELGPKASKIVPTETFGGVSLWFFVVIP